MCPDQKNSLRIGSFVKVIGKPWGIGKLLAVSECKTKATIGFFVSLAKPLIQKTVMLKRVESVVLANNSRAYVRSADDRWYIGRIQDLRDGKYRIALPDRTFSRVRETYTFFYVRCEVPIGDPTEVLVYKGHETASFHTFRSDFMRVLIAQRGASYGMPGLLSSRIHLIPHQVEVVRRVLEDPVQRYLLADEVGLGKTIEAGIILRQFLLDRPNDKAYIVVPPHLFEQWRIELDSKFITSHDQERVCLIKADEFGQVPLDNPPGMLIIDEAQHLAAKAFSPDLLEKEQYQKYLSLAMLAPRLLLLSATPVLNHEKDFLGMLHLLDPDNYHLEDLEKFRMKVERRQDVGRLLLSLKEGSHPVVIKSSIRRLKELFTWDTILRVLIEKLEELVVSPGYDKNHCNKIIRQIRVHLSETYRLHRRMLRNRRESVVDCLAAIRYDANAPKHQLTREYESDERSPEIQDLLDEWRDAAYSSFLYQKSEEKERREQELVSVFKILWEGAGTWLGTLKVMLNARLRASSEQSNLSLLSKEQLTLLKEVPLFEGEREILKAILQVIGELPVGIDRIQQVCKLLNKYRPVGSRVYKCIIFTGHTLSAVELINVIRAVCGRSTVTSHLAQDNQDIQKANLKKFKTDRSCFILVCDASAEEGLNLQYVDVLIHFDLPCSPNRMEQRIGRVDRIGRTKPLQSHVIIGSQVSRCLNQAWFEVLHDGLGVFTNSIASLQFYVDKKMYPLLKTAFYQGDQGLKEIIPSVQEEIETEQIMISEQQVLDEIDVLNTRSTLYYETLMGVENEWKTIDRHCDEWIGYALQFKHSRSSLSIEECTYSVRDNTLIPSDKLSEVRTILNSSGTYNRHIAVTHPEIVLYRIGESFIDWLYKYLLWDDRGKAFAIWRCDPFWDDRDGAEWVGFRFDYIVEADTRRANKILAEKGIPKSEKKALLRQADAFLPPFMITLFVNGSLKEETSEQVLPILRRPFRRPTQDDINLSKERLAIIDEIVSADNWTNFCHSARLTSEEILKGMPIYAEKCQDGSEKAQAVFGVRLAQLRLRFEMENVEEHRGDIEIEEQLCEALLEGFKNPKITLDAVGFIVISGRNPVTGRSVNKL